MQIEPFGVRPLTTVFPPTFSHNGQVKVVRVKPKSQFVQLVLGKSPTIPVERAQETALLMLLVGP